MVLDQERKCFYGCGTWSGFFQYLCATSDTLLNGAYDFEFGVKSSNVQSTFSIRSAGFFPEDLPSSFFCVLRGAQRTLKGVQPLVPRYRPGYQWYHGIRTTLGQHCTAECRLALRDVYSHEAIGTFL